MATKKDTKPTIKKVDAAEKKVSTKKSIKPTDKKITPAKKAEVKTKIVEVEAKMNEPKKKVETVKVEKKSKPRRKVVKAPVIEKIVEDIVPKVLVKPPVKRDIAPKPPISSKQSKDEVEKTSFSQAELEEFREIIHSKLSDARKDLDLLKESLSNKDNGTEDTSPTFKLLEDGSDVLSKEEVAQLAARQQKFITNLENALIRIENKTYGICRVTGKLIAKERLKIVPHATLSMEAKLSQ